MRGKTGFFIISFLVVILVGFLIWSSAGPLNPRNADDISNVAVEFHGMIFDVLLFGIILTIYETFSERRDRIRRYQEELDDYRRWNENEAAFRVAGSVKRLLDEREKTGPLVKIMTWIKRKIISLFTNQEKKEIKDFLKRFIKEDEIEHVKRWVKKLDIGKQIEIDLSNLHVGEIPNNAGEAGKNLVVKAIKLGVDFISMKEINLKNVNLKGSRFFQKNLENADLSDSILREANLSLVNLKNASLARTNFFQAELMYANLENAKLDEAKLGEAKLIGANLKNAAFTLANLSKANLRDADLQGAYFLEADLQNAILLGAKAWKSQREEFSKVMNHDQLDSIIWVDDPEKHSL